LARASDTAKEIAKFHPNAKLYSVEELREKDQGSLTGRLVDQIDWNKPRDTEKKEQMYKRAKKPFEKVYKKHKGETVLFVSHGGLIRILIAHLTNIPLEDAKKLGDLHNTSVSIFEIRENADHRKIVINCNKHLR